MKKDGPRKSRTSRSLTAQTEPVSTDLQAKLLTPNTSPATATLADPGKPSNIASTLFTDNHVGPRGPSRPSAIFAENHANLGSGLWDAETEVSDHDYLQNKEAKLSHATYENIQSGISILLALPDQVRCTTLIQRYFTALHPMDPILHRPTIEFWHSGLWDSFAEYLEEPRDPEKLQTATQTICKNQLARTDVETHKPYSRWVGAFTGPRLRWETVGILFAICGISCMTYPIWTYSRNPIDKDLTREGFALRMLSCCRDCLQICESFGGVNDSRIYLIYLLLTLRFMCGEEEVEHRPWSIRGELISAVTELGLHHRKETELSTSPLLSQFRKRTFAACFSLDKLMSTHTGRPPALSRHYCSTQNPLDIDDDQFAADPEDLRLVGGSIGDTGWNTLGDVYPSTYLRALMIMSGIRDMILEVFLGSPDEPVEQRVSNLKVASEHAYASLAPQIKIEAQEIPLEMTSPATLMQRIFVSLEFKYSLFLLERVTSNSNPAHRRSLLIVAQDILEMILNMWSRRDFMVDFQWQFTWVIMEYGIPSSGALCMELLQQMRHPTAGSDAVARPLLISRVQTIQTLSLFISCLDWVSAEVLGMSKFYDRMCNIIKRILERVLTPVAAETMSTAVLQRPLSEEAQHSVSPAGENLDFPEPDSGNAGIDVENGLGGLFDWPDFLDWNQESWMDVLEGSNSFMTLPNQGS